MARRTEEPRLTVVDDLGYERELNAKFEVCGRCHGTGRHVNPNVDGDGLSSEDFDEDPGFREAYFSGMYDVRCYECGGARVVPVVDEDRNPKELVELYYAAEQEIRECEQMERMERMMGA